MIHIGLVSTSTSGSAKQSFGISHAVSGCCKRQANDKDSLCGSFLLSLFGDGVAGVGDTGPEHLPDFTGKTVIYEKGISELTHEELILRGDILADDLSTLPSQSDHVT